MILMTDRISLYLKNYRAYECFQGLAPIFLTFLFYTQSLDFLKTEFFLFPLLLAANLFIFIFNDYCDFDGDKINPRKSYIFLMDQNKRKRVLQIVLLFISASFFYTPGEYSFILLSLLLLGYLYSDRLFFFKKKKFLSLFVHFSYGFFSSTFCFFSPSSPIPLTWESFLGCVGFGFLFTAGSFMSVLLDKDFDRMSWSIGDQLNSKEMMNNIFGLLFLANVCFCLAFFLFKSLKITFLYAFIFLIPLIFNYYVSSFNIQSHYKAFRNSYRVTYFFFFGTSLWLKIS